jgi:hypothetical protein
MEQSRRSLTDRLAEIRFTVKERQDQPKPFGMKKVTGGVWEGWEWS